MRTFLPYPVGLQPTATIRQALLALALGLLLIQPVALLASTAPESSFRKETERLLNTAAAHYRAGRFVLAAQRYHEAFASDPRQPRLLYGAGRAEQKAGQLTKAHATFLDVVRRTSPRARFHQKALQRLAQIRLQRSNLRTAESSERSGPSVDTIQTTQADVALSRRSWPGVLALGSGLATAAAAGGLLAWAAVDQASLDAKQVHGSSGKIEAVSYDEAVSLQRSINTRMTVGLVGVGLGAVIVGLGWWFTRKGDTTIALAPWLTPDGDRGRGFLTGFVARTS